jgi:toxin-antitoxin system PIN domain toxin
MQLLDVNILIEAHRKDAPKHEEVSAWLMRELQTYPGVAVSEFVLSSFLRIVTHPKIFKMPTPLPEALEFVEDFRSRKSIRIAMPGDTHWRIFMDLLERYEATGNLIPDAYHAALALENGDTWISLDRGFARYTCLDWRHPLD